jgi:hypothetical protein
MHSCTTPVLRKRLVDPAACGVRLGVELRAAAEREAYRSGMCLSLWIKQVVEEALTRISRRQGDAEPVRESNLAKRGLETEFAKDMEKLNDR